MSSALLIQIDPNCLEPGDKVCVIPSDLRTIVFVTVSPQHTLDTDNDSVKIDPNVPYVIHSDNRYYVYAAMSRQFRNPHLRDVIDTIPIESGTERLLRISYANVKAGDLKIGDLYKSRACQNARRIIDVTQTNNNIKFQTFDGLPYIMNSDTDVGRVQLEFLGG
jgi:hypothetical protein